MATALAIAGGFAGTFMEGLAKQQATDLALREPLKPDWTTARPLPTRVDNAVLRGSVNEPAPSTSGIASPPAPSPAPPVRPDAAQPVRSAAIDKSADPGAVHQQAPAATPQKKVRKPRPVQRKPKPEWYEDENLYANRNRGGFFGMFR